MSHPPSPKPPQDPWKPASPGLRRPGAPAAGAVPAAVFIPGARARTAGRRAGSGWGGQDVPRGPAPSWAAPPPRAALRTPGTGTPAPAGSAARCRVRGLAGGRASLRKATSRPFLQCE